MARHISETGHGAFTWTGPYGGGKSSLVIALGALLAGDVKQRRRAAGIFGGEVARAVGKALPPGTKGWRVVPVIGRREDPSQVIGEALVAAKVARPPAGGWNEDAVIRAAARAARAAERRNERGGLAIFIDEMGKFLEAAARDGSDIHVFQQLAEIASRAGGRLLVIGVLHQAFEEYARRFSREMQDEWAKVQGRFIDLAVSASGEEQIELISRAIGREREINEAGKEARGIAEMIRGKRTTDSDPLPLMLERCRPLHPVVVCLLGPMSRRRFGQNQRSVFGFLNSAEPHGLQDFIARADNRRLYGPDHLRDYLRVNLEPSILASPDGHLWALAADAIERCEAVGGDALHLGLLKTIAVVSLFRERSGLPASRDLLQICFPDVPKRTLKKALDQLDQWSLVIFRKHLGAYAIFAGSDFDVDEAVRTALGEIGEIDFPALKKIAGLQPVLAKRHYHDTGAMRWFDVNICPLREVQDVAARGELRDGAIGQFLLAIPDGKEDETEATDLCRKAARAGGGRDVVVGVSKRSAAIVSLARESLALDLVRRDRPELAGDAVARREVESRLSEITGRIGLQLPAAYDGELWHRKRHEPAAYRRVERN
ncbi:MAG: hypothetical protein MPJ22_01220, partial [Pirellulales bacterium]|nr:hypothetical protein [Pirellulales bacterium]